MEENRSKESFRSPLVAEEEAEKIEFKKPVLVVVGRVGKALADLDKVTEEKKVETPPEKVQESSAKSSLKPAVLLKELSTPIPSKEPKWSGSCPADDCGPGVSVIEYNRQDSRCIKGDHSPPTFDEENCPDNYGRDNKKVIMKKLLDEIHNERIFEILGVTEMTNYKNYVEKHKPNKVDFISYLKRSINYKNSSKCRHFNHEIKKRMLKESEKAFEESRILEIVADCTQEAFSNKVGLLYRLCWLVEIDDEKKKLKIDHCTVNLIFRLFFDVTRFNWNDYLCILGELMSLGEIKGMIKETKYFKSNIRMTPRQKNAKTTDNTQHSKKNTKRGNNSVNEKFCTALVRNISSKLDLVLEDEWKGLFEIIDPSMESFEQILDYTDRIESDKTRDDIKAFFKDLISILRVYGMCFRKGEVRELFEVLKKVIDGEMINFKDLKAICRIYYVIDTLENFKNHFYRTPGFAGSYVNIVNTLFLFPDRFKDICT